MNNEGCRPFPWTVILIASAALFAFGADLSFTPGPPVWFWTATYWIPAGGLIVWRITHLRDVLFIVCSTLFAVSITRAVLIAQVYPDRYSGVAAHALIASFAAMTLRDYGRCST